jgi:hypothetical protein
MYSCYDCHLIFGWREVDRNAIIDPEWLNDKFDGEVEIFAEDIVRNYIGNAIYGVIVSYKSTNDGIVSSTESANKKEAITKIFEEIMTLRGIENVEEHALGYHIAMSGDFEICQESYIPI